MPRVPGPWLHLAWELASLRVAEVLEAPVRQQRGLALSTGSWVFPELLAEHIQHCTERAKLHQRWSLSLHYEAGRTVWRIAPSCSDDVPPSLLQADATIIAEGLADLLRSRAERAAQDHPGISSLTPRERVVLLGLLDGLSVRTLARHLFVSRHTVRNQMRAIYAKLGVHSHDALLETFAGRASPFEVQQGRARRPSVVPLARRPRHHAREGSPPPCGGKTVPRSGSGGP